MKRVLMARGYIAYLAFVQTILSLAWIGDAMFDSTKGHVSPAAAYESSSVALLLWVLYAVLVTESK